MFYACTAFDDGSVILAGTTEGDWGQESSGGADFAMVKLNALGFEEWRWQVYLIVFPRREDDTCIYLNYKPRRRTKLVSTSPMMVVR